MNFCSIRTSGGWSTAPPLGRWLLKVVGPRLPPNPKPYTEVEDVDLTATKKTAQQHEDHRSKRDKGFHYHVKVNRMMMRMR